MISRTKFAQNAYFGSETKKKWVSSKELTRISVAGNKSHLKQFCFFGPNLRLLSKTETVNITIVFSVIELVEVPNFSLMRQFWVFGTRINKSAPQSNVSLVYKDINTNSRMMENLQIEKSSFFLAQLGFDILNSVITAAS